MRKPSSSSASYYITSQNITSHHKKVQNKCIDNRIGHLEILFIWKTGNEVVCLALKIFITKGWRSQGSSIFQQVVHCHIPYRYLRIFVTFLLAATLHWCSFCSETPSVLEFQCAVFTIQLFFFFFFFGNLIIKVDWAVYIFPLCNVIELTWE